LNISIVLKTTLPFAPGKERFAALVVNTVVVSPGEVHGSDTEGETATAQAIPSFKEAGRPFMEGRAGHFAETPPFFLL
jgi:hypothetical protein